MTPMTEIEKLKDGVYEKVMSRRFAEVLKEALAEDQVRAEEEDVDAEEAVGYLSSYLQEDRRAWRRSGGGEGTISAEILRA